MNHDLVNKPVQPILQCMSSLVILLKVACDRILTRELVSYSIQIFTILAGFE